MKNRSQNRNQAPVEMQMGPMIDMVFLLLVFFIVTARPVKPEKDISLTLPGQMEQDEPLELPDEQRIRILASGQVLLNDLDVSAGGSLASLIEILTRFRVSAENNQDSPLVTLNPEDRVPHQRVVDVLNACAVAGISGITFADDASGQGGEG